MQSYKIFPAKNVLLNKMIKFLKYGATYLVLFLFIIYLIILSQEPLANLFGEEWFWPVIFIVEEVVGLKPWFCKILGVSIFSGIFSFHVIRLFIFSFEKYTLKNLIKFFIYAVTFLVIILFIFYSIIFSIETLVDLGDEVWPYGDEKWNYAAFLILAVGTIFSGHFSYYVVRRFILWFEKCTLKNLIKFFIYAVTFLVIFLFIFSKIIVFFATLIRLVGEEVGLGPWFSMIFVAAMFSGVLSYYVLRLFNLSFDKYILNHLIKFFIYAVTYLVLFSFIFYSLILSIEPLANLFLEIAFLVEPNAVIFILLVGAILIGHFYNYYAVAYFLLFSFIFFLIFLSIEPLLNFLSEIGIEVGIEVGPYAVIFILVVGPILIGRFSYYVLRRFILSVEKYTQNNRVKFLKFAVTYLALFLFLFYLIILFYEELLLLLFTMVGVGTIFSGRFSYFGVRKMYSLII